MGETSVDVFAKEITGIFRDHRLTRTKAVDIQALSLEEAYAVQEKYLAARIASGERFIGYKVGCTSPAIRGQLGSVSEIDSQSAKNLYGRAEGFCMIHL